MIGRSRRRSRGWRTATRSCPSGSRASGRRSAPTSSPAARSGTPPARPSRRRTWARSRQRAEALVRAARRPAGAGTRGPAPRTCSSTRTSSSTCSSAATSDDFYGLIDERGDRGRPPASTGSSARTSSACCRSRRRHAVIAARDAPHLFAAFFQIRRAFHHIFRNIVGSSAPVVRLRAAVWQSIFTHDMRRYRRSLYRAHGRRGHADLRPVGHRQGAGGAGDRPVALRPVRRRAAAPSPRASPARSTRSTSRRCRPR